MLGECLELARPAEATTEACFVVLKGPLRAEDAPTRVLMVAGDIPRRDEPLPRFIDEAGLSRTAS